MPAHPVPTSRIWPAVLAAGPVFIAMILLRPLIGPHAQPVSIQALGAFYALPLVTAFGGLIALVPIALGTRAMRGLADMTDAGRLAVLWWLAGGGAGAAIAWAFQSGSDGIAIMAGTGAIYAGISHAGQRW